MESTRLTIYVTPEFRNSKFRHLTTNLSSDGWEEFVDQVNSILAVHYTDAGVEWIDISVRNVRPFRVELNYHSNSHNGENPRDLASGLKWFITTKIRKEGFFPIDFEFKAISHSGATFFV